jgi:hypothetical protein
MTACGIFTFVWYRPRGAKRHKHRRRIVLILPDADTLHHLYVVEGKTLREIAAMTHCHMHTLLAAMDVAGIVRRRRGRRRAPIPAIDPAVLAEIARLGGRARARQIARTLGLNREKFDRLIGNRPANRGRIEQQVLHAHDDAIRAAYEAGVPVKELAQRYGCSRRAISRSLDRTVPVMTAE